VNPPVLVTVWPSPLVTTTFAAPAEPAGVVAVIDVDDTKVTPVAATPPTVTPKDAPDAKSVPVIVIGVPPEVLPVEGEMPEIVGAAAALAITIVTGLPA
jgi:hypothetical protein